jgi:hypothetical protein
VTAKHNLRSHIKEAQGVEARDTPLCLKSDQGKAVLTFNDLNWQLDSDTSSSIRLREDVTWAFGVDISVGKQIDSHTDGVTSQASSFEVVRPNFSFEKGQRIGVGIYMSRKPTLITARHSVDHPLVGVTEDDLLSVFGGVPGRVYIYTGRITFVGENHIEHDINTFTGCAGAIVFLLDKDQPASVNRVDHGNAIAVIFDSTVAI